MRNLFIYLIIGFTTLNVATLNQFPRIAMLIVHFMEHQERDNKITLADFLNMHYMGHDANDGDDQKDAQLPFKSLSALSMVQFTYPTPIEITLSNLDFLAEINHSHFWYQDVSDPHIISQLRPPSPIV